jgi:hypothetical protein
VVDYSFSTMAPLPPAGKPNDSSKRVLTLTRQMKLHLQAQGPIAGFFASTTRGRPKKQKFMIQATDDGSNAAADPVPVPCFVLKQSNRKRCEKHYDFLVKKERLQQASTRHCQSSTASMQVHPSSDL